MAKEKKILHTFIIQIIMMGKGHRDSFLAVEFEQIDSSRYFFSVISSLYLLLNDEGGKKLEHQQQGQLV